MTKVAYITSGKIGIPRFTYNELDELSVQNIDFVLCLTQLKSGPWMPQPNWELVVTSKRTSLLALFALVLAKSRVFFSLLNFARKNRVIPYFLISTSLYYQLRKDRKISSLHCQMGDKKLYIGYFLKQLLKLPLTVTVHAHELYQRKVYDDNISMRNLFSNCDKIITISEFNSKIIKDVLTDESEKVQVMHLFPVIDFENKIQDKTKVLIVANWAEKKGYKVLFEAIQKINRNDFVIWVVGDSYFSDNSLDLRKLVLEYGIEDKVALLGRQGGVTLDIIFSSCDIFCLPSYTEYYDDGKPAEREGIPVALMEAMAWGKPVISTKHAGIPELVNDILIDEKNVPQLKDALVYLLDNPEKRIEFGEKNKTIISRKFKKENVVILSGIFKSWE